MGFKFLFEKQVVLCSYKDKAALALDPVRGAAGADFFLLGTKSTKASCLANEAVPSYSGLVLLSPSSPHLCPSLIQQ